MLHLKRNESKVLVIWLILVMLFSYKLGLLGAVSTVYGLMLLALVIGMGLLLIISVLILIYVHLKRKY